MEIIENQVIQASALRSMASIFANALSNKRTTKHFREFWCPDT